jgi:hypothetical protein
MSTQPAATDGSEVQVNVYDGDRLLTAAACRLWLGANPPHGTMAVPGNQNWVVFAHLTLQAADGTRYSILPTRVSHVAGQQQELSFNIDS